MEEPMRTLALRVPETGMFATELPCGFALARAPERLLHPQRTQLSGPSPVGELLECSCSARDGSNAPFLARLLNGFRKGLIRRSRRPTNHHEKNIKDE